MPKTQKDSLTIPIRKAMVLWNDIPPRDNGSIIVVEHCVHRSDGYTYSDGACTAGWEKGTDVQMREKLCALAWHISYHYGFHPKTIADALCVIEEFAEDH